MLYAGDAEKTPPVRGYEHTLQASRL